MGGRRTGTYNDEVLTAVPETASRQPRPAASSIQDGASPREKFAADLRAALSDGRVPEARNLVAAAETELRRLSPDDIGVTGAGITAIDLAAAKARIAASIGDDLAAHAILLHAIETLSDTGALRILMTELMLASGRATDIRPVQRHIGQPPGNLEKVDDAKSS